MPIHQIFKGNEMKNYGYKFNIAGEVTCTVKATSSKNADRIVQIHLEGVKRNVYAEMKDSMLVTTRITQISSLK